MNKIKLLLASNNYHKAVEFSQILNFNFPDKIELLLPKDILKHVPEVEETGATLEENARIKAEFIFNKTGIPCFADDTGLEIKSLNNMPGVLSARFSGVHGSDCNNRKKVLDLMKNIPKEFRTACFRTVICFVDDSSTHFADGICPGEIIFEERGEMGFGYDSLFVPDGYKLTFAEMEPDEKNKISHRSRATDAFLKILERQFLEKHLSIIDF